MKTNKILKLIPQIVILFVAAFLIFGLSYLIFAAAFKSNFYFDMGEKGAQIGDSMGVLNSFFSLLAVIGVVVSLYLQRKAMEKQESEIQQTRNMYIKAHFESTLHSLLANVQKNIAETSGDFTNSQNIWRVASGISYFNKLYEEVRILDKLLRLRMYKDPTSNHHPMNIASYYGINMENKVLIEPIANEQSDAFSYHLIQLVTNKRQQEYFDAWQNYLLVISALQSEYDMWLTSGLWDRKDTNRIFKSYVDIMKSAIPASALLYFLYMTKTMTLTPTNNFIFNTLYKETATADFIDEHHYDLLFK